MVIPPYILVTSFVAMMALGGYVVYKAVSSPPVGGASEINAFGSKFVLKGPAWLVMIAVGALITAVPIIAAVLQNNSLVPFEPSAPAKVMSKIRDPKYANFEFKSDATSLDLRNTLTRPWYAYLPGWKRVFGRHVRIRPASLLDYMEITKTGNADEISVRYTTSGLLDLRCLNYDCSVQTSFEDDQNVGEITANVSSVKVGDTFPLVTEVTYWNAFSGVAGDDFTVSTHEGQSKSEDLSVVVMFPDKKPFRTMDLQARLREAEKMGPVQGMSESWPGGGNKSYYWSHTNTATGKWFYELKWTW